MITRVDQDDCSAAGVDCRRYRFDGICVASVPAFRETRFISRGTVLVRPDCDAVTSVAQLHFEPRMLFRLVDFVVP